MTPPYCHLTYPRRNRSSRKKQHGITWNALWGCAARSYSICTRFPRQRQPAPGGITRWARSRCRRCCTNWRIMIWGIFGKSRSCIAPTPFIHTRDRFKSIRIQDHSAGYVEQAALDSRQRLMLTDRFVGAHRLVGDVSFASLHSIVDTELADGTECLVVKGGNT